MTQQQQDAWELIKIMRCSLAVMHGDGDISTEEAIRKAQALNEMQKQVMES